MNKAAWGFVLASFASLLASSYFDNIRGPLIPQVAAELGLSFATSGWFLTVGYMAATATTFGLLYALNLWSERTIMIVTTLLGVVTGFAATFVTGTLSLMILAGLVGTTISMLGTMSNVLIVEGAPPQLMGRYLSALHSMFGIGAMVGTAGIGIGMAYGLPWTRFYLGGIPICILLLVFSAQSLHRQGRRGPVTVQPVRLDPAQALVVLTFAVYVAAEVSAAMWMTSYLVEVRHFTVAKAAPYVTFYFLTLTVTRLLSAAFITPAREPRALKAALLLPIVFLALGYGGATWAFALVGCYGPFFPVFRSLSSRAFPVTWRSLTIWTIVAMNALLCTASITLGSLADLFGIRVAYGLPAILLALAFVLLNLCLKKLPVAPIEQ